MIRVHQDWQTPAFDLPSVAPRVGPFVRRDLLQVWWEHRGAKLGGLRLVESDDALFPLFAGADGVECLGEEHLIDYHSPLGSGADALTAEYLATLPPGTPFRFDSLPAEAADTVAKGLHQAAADFTSVQHEVTAVLRLPGSFDDYLAGLSKKERHETRRKRRRFEAALGTPRLIRAAGKDAVTAFVDMHREAPGEKGRFMTHEMAALFLDLHRRAGAVIDFLYGDGPDPVAAGVGFEEGDTYYLYNSAYRFAAAEHAPGIVLVTELIAAAIASERTVFDFLKGDETYKFRLGAEPRPLHVLAGRTAS